MVARKETVPNQVRLPTKELRHFVQALTKHPTIYTHMHNYQQDDNKVNDTKLQILNRNFRVLLRGYIQDNSTSALLESQRFRNKSVLNTLLGYEKGEPFLPTITGSCPYMAIRPKMVPLNSNERSNTHCVPHSPSQQDCLDAQKAYKINQRPLTCRTQPETPLCSIAESWRHSQYARVAVDCDLSRCGGSPVNVASVDPSIGTLENENKWLRFYSKEKLEEYLPTIVARNSLNGFNFCFLRCKHPGKTSEVMELLTFPPVMKKQSRKVNQELFNFNVLVLDSVSRAHFYRSLPRSVTSLRNIVHDPKIKATALDFELLQSVAAHTFQNMKAFFSGSIKFDHDAHGNTIQRLGIEVLFNDLKKRGYQTLLQEDVCWFDEWGTLLGNNIMQGKKPVGRQQFKERWKRFRQNVTSYEVDDEGLSVFSCEVFKLFNSTNQFNRPRRVCFSGRPLADYFIKYQSGFLAAHKDSDQGRPFFAYTHLATGHDVTGQRIRQIDKQLSQFLHSSAQDQNTITLIFSDHGEKTTHYSSASLQGRQEIYDSLFFAMISEGVAQKLGKGRLRAMIVNQRRLITTTELHNAIMSIGNRNRSNSKEFLKEGIFAEVPANQKCSALSMQPLAVCKCKGWEDWLPEDEPTLPWITEFALGQINNRIQSYVATYKEKLGKSLDAVTFDKCQRLSGHYFDKARRRVDGNNFVVSLDIVVVPLFEVFEVQVRYPRSTPWPNPRRKTYPKMKPVARLSSFRRVSVYRSFAVCCDDGVLVQLCVCKDKIKSKSFSSVKLMWSNLTTQESFLDYLEHSVYFGARTEVTVLHGRNCLILLTRLHKRKTKVLEIANSCIDRKYHVSVSGRSQRIAMISSPLPMSLEVLPRRIHFLFTVYHLQKPYNFIPDVEFTMTNV